MTEPVMQSEREDLGARIHWFPISVGSYFLATLAASLSPIQIIGGIRVQVMATLFVLAVLSWIRLSLWLFKTDLKGNR